MKKELIEHPRPQFIRNEWENLNGKWDFAFDDDNQGEEKGWYREHSFEKKIEVPFTYESKLSGIGEGKFHPVVWYARNFSIPEDYTNRNVLLHFQASDYLTKVWVNGQYIGEHKGGNSAFHFDVTTNIQSNGKNKVVVKVEDSQDVEQPRGKQRWKDENFGCWYVQTTGIWQTVWMEFVSDTRIEHVKMTPHLKRESIEFQYELKGKIEKELEVRTDITFNGKRIKNFCCNVDSKRIVMEVELTSDIHEWGLMVWSPEHPHLYDVTFSLIEGGQVIDEVASYFGMREISIEQDQVLLNNKPIYQKLILDQGYWPDSLLTPPSEEALIEDIDKIIEMGFNGVRKHQKLEDERFLYWCDKKGLLVWSEMASTYGYTDQAVENLTTEWLEILHQYYNHPSIVTWVPFNESWGIHQVYEDAKQQHFTESIYHLTKAIDPYRPVIVNDGWEHTVSDIVTLHDYEEVGEFLLNRYKNQEQILSNKKPHNKDKFAMAKGYNYQGQPVIISEYGGIAFLSEKGWGYGNQVESEKEFMDRFRSLTESIKQLDYVSGYCYTQITDVQQEINGLLSENREAKVPLGEIRKINNL